MYKLVRFQPKRTFGVELEFGRSTNRQRLRDIIMEVGEPAIVMDWGHHSHNRDWLCKTDSSCGYEAASRVMGSTRSVRKTVQDLVILGKVVQALRDSHCEVTDQCGLHIHVWVGDLAESQYHDLLTYWVKFEKMIMDMVPVRRKVNSFCPSPSSRLDPDKGMSLGELQDSAYCGRGSLNIGWYYDRKTIEFRIAEGSVDPYSIKNWVRLAIYFVECVKNGMERPENCNWLSIEECLIRLNLLNGKESSEYTILSPALSELRTWILRRCNENAGFRDADGVRERTKAILSKIG